MYKNPEGNRRRKYKGSQRERADKVREEVIEEQESLGIKK